MNSKIIKTGILIAVIVVIAAGFYCFHEKTKPSSRSGLVIPIKNDSKVSTIIVPHFDMVADQRKSFLNSLGSKDIKTVILVSPNHSGNGSDDVLTTDRVWNLDQSKIDPDKKSISYLSKHKDLGLDQNNVLVSDQGIVNILSDISSSFPKASIVPIIIKQDANKEKVNSLLDGLKQVCADDCILIASIDFSHYQPGALAEIHDEESIRALSDQNENLAYSAEVDSNQALALAVDWSKHNLTNNFHLSFHTNSGKIENSADIESVSSVMGYYDEQKVTSLDDSITFTFAGDMMFGRAINYFFQGNKIFNVMSNLGNRLFWGTDVSMVNLEGPISTTPVVPDDTANNMVFNFPPKSVDVLKWLHIGAVSLANNHSLNQGRTGIEMTRNLLEAQGISPVGDESEFGDFSVKEFSNGSMKLAVITINSLETDTSLETTIKKEKAAGAKVVVFPHWGVEYDTTHNSNQEKLAHQWIDWGADLIIGSHSHVVEDAEVYKGKPIFYSMGNLLFDQNFSQETQEGLIVSGEFTKNSIELVLLPTVSKKYKPELQIGQKKSDIINNFRKELGLQSCDGNYDCAKIELKY